MSLNQLFGKKKLDDLLAEMAGDHRLRRVLGPVTLTSLGVGAVIGAGIFVATGAAANQTAGPALMVSYVVAGITCIFAALCYAEFASMAPVAGSAYTYAYATLGELFAWIIGWDLILEYAVGAATVANGWSGYLQESVLPKLWLTIPFVLSGAPQKYDEGHILPNIRADFDGGPVTQRVIKEAVTKEAGKKVAAENIFWVRLNVKGYYGNAAVAQQVVKDGLFWVTTEAPPSPKGGAEKVPPEMMLPKDTPVGKVNDPAVEAKITHRQYSASTIKIGLVGDPAVEAKITNRQQAVVNIMAVLAVFVVTLVLVKGIKESAGFNAAMVLVKVAAVLFVIFVGAYYVNPANWRPFAPYGWTGLSFFGKRILGGVNSGGDPVGMLAGTAIIFFAYIGFDSVSTHAEEAKNPRRDVPIAIIASLLICTVLYIGVVAVLTGMVPYNKLSIEAGVSNAFQQCGLPWAEFIVATAGVAGITSVLLVMMLSAPRVFLAMARDGLVPKKFFADVHPKFQTPWKSTILIGVFVALLSGLLPINALLHMTNIGTLFAFVIVCIAVLVMRVINPGAARPFRCPWVPVVPILGIVCCSILMFSLPAANWWRLIIWLALGLVIYFAYGYRHSILGHELRDEIRKHGASGAGSLRD
ncbi:MAG: amino acid permease [Planctomycetia bacterium]|nr:amino acid permease [Planctomycetia bacterium]